MGADAQKLQARIASLEAELERLRQQYELPYRVVVEDMSELVVRWLPDGTRLFVNDAYCRLFRQSRERLVGTSFWELITEEDREEVRSRLASLGPKHQVSRDRHRAIAGDGRTIWMEWVDRAIFDDDGNVVEYQSVGRDITDRVALEAQARRVDRADAVARSSAAIAHDLKNILQVMSGLSDLLRLRDLAKDLDTLTSAIHQANDLVEQLEGVRHGTVLRPQRLDVNERVTGLMGLLREVCGPRIWLQTRLAPEPAWLVGDPTQIDQILLNLVRNAAESITERGSVVIATELVAASQLPEHQRPTNALFCVVLRVSDTGSGIDPMLLPRIFDAQVTTKRDGRGLGLATVKALVDGHSAIIDVRSSDRGTTFDVIFPEA